jgi:two-component system, NarL family, response regulator LiaR
VNTISIVLADDHQVVAHSLKAYLESFSDLTVIGIASTGEELLSRLDEWRPRVILQDLLMPGGIDGIETTRRVLQRHPEIAVVALTASMDEARMIGVLRAGALGYVRKDAAPETLLAAVRSVARGRTYIDPSIDRTAHLTSTDAEALTTRETEVLRHLALGLSNRDIAAALSVSEETVKTHVTHVLAKLNVDNRAQAIVQALKRGLVALDELE